MSDELPAGWAWATLSDLVERLQYGHTASANPALQGTRFLRITDLGEEGIAWSSVPGCEITEAERNTYALADGDIVFARTGSIEKAAVVRRPPDAVFASYLIRGRPLTRGLSDWIGRFVRSPSYLEQIGAVGAGIGRENVNAKKLGAVRVPVAPEAEQRRIVAKLDEMLARIRAARATLAAVTALIDRYRQAVLETAFRGELTAEWREQRGGADRLESPGELPAGWRWSNLGDLVHSFDRLRVPVKDSERRKRPGPYTYYGAFGPIDTIDEFLFDGSFLLLAEDGKNLLGRTRPIAFRADGRFWVNNHAHVLQPRGDLPLEYLQYYLNATDVRPYITGIDQVKLTAGAMNRIPVPIAPPEEQTVLVERCSMALDVSSRLRALVQSALEDLQRLERVANVRAFRGELVPQDPADEPASVLLERVRAVASGSAPRGRRARTRA